MNELLHELACRHLDGTASDEERTSLAARLRADPAARREYLLLLEQESRLREHAGAVLSGTARIALQGRRGVRRRAWPGRPLLLAAACLVLAAGGMLGLHLAGRQEVVGHLGGAVIRSGDQVIGPGTVQLADGGSGELSSGAGLVISRAVGHPLHLALGSGRIDLDIPPGGRGLAVATTQAEIAVLGTAFAVAASGGETQVEVGRGMVRCTPLHGGPPAVLQRGDTARISDGALQVGGPRRDQPARLDDVRRWLAVGALEAMPGVGSVAFVASAGRNGGWIGRSFTWTQPIDASEGAALAARLATAGGGLWHLDLFLAPEPPDDATEGQPKRCLRLAVRAGRPTVERLDDGPDVRETLWQGPRLAAGPHALRLVLQAGSILARIDGRTVWQGICPYPTVHAGLRFSRREAGTAQAIVDGLELAPP